MHITYILFLVVIPHQYAPKVTVPNASIHNTTKFPSMFPVGGAYSCTLTSLPKSCTNILEIYIFLMTNNE